MMAATIAALLLARASAYATDAFDRDAPGNRITGMMIAVYTPMQSNGLSLDLDTLPKYASFLASRNITNIMPAGSNGESLSLTVPERKALAEAWVAAAKPHGLNVYMHVGSESLVESIELAQHAATAGVAGILAMTPVYFKPTTDTLIEFLAAVAAAAPKLPFWFYHFPDDTGVLPGRAHEFLEAADASGKIPTLMGIKYTDYNLMDFQLCTLVGGKGKYNMLYGTCPCRSMALSAPPTLADLLPLLQQAATSRQSRRSSSAPRRRSPRPSATRRRCATRWCSGWRASRRTPSSSRTSTPSSAPSSDGTSRRPSTCRRTS